MNFYVFYFDLKTINSDFNILNYYLVNYVGAVSFAILGSVGTL
jgi:hypothetical protein